MPELKLPKKPVENWEHVRDEWIQAVEQLVSKVESWCREKEWPTRRIDKRLEDTRIGEYVVPALLLQVDLVKLLLEPIARYAPGSDGVVDLYRMPEYDDVATIYRRNDAWEVHYRVAGDAIPPDLRQSDPSILVAEMIQPFTIQEFAKIVKLMV